MSYRHWNSSLSKSESVCFTRNLAHLFVNRITDTALQAQIRSLLENDDFLGLVTFEPPYNSGYSTADILNLRQCLALYQKRLDLDLGIDRRGAAIQKWEEAEAACRLTNETFRAWSQGRFQFAPFVEQVFHSAQRKISKVLGDVPSFDDIKFRFGPGATTTIAKKNASHRRKVGDVFSCSANSALVAERLLETMGQIYHPVFSEDSAATAVRVSLNVSISRIEFVPKNARTDRSVAIEPGLNIYGQLGFGDYISSRLERFGIGTRNQGPNQKAAMRGSISGALATLDLSSASDTIASGLVYHLLPIDWSTLLDQLRSQEVLLDGQVRFLQKFSSMGNGFTFPLETLIFWALTASSVEALGYDAREVVVYGDDIICPTVCYDAVVSVLSASGFTVNTGKSYRDGPFRESCGKDYYLGIDIRPVYLKDRPTYADVFRLHNFFYRNYDEEVCSFLLSIIPEDIRIFGPDGYGDGHLLGASPPKPHNRGLGWGGYTFETYTFRSRKNFRPFPGDYVYPSYCVYAGLSSESSHEHRRGRLGVVTPGVLGYKRIKIYTLQP